MTEEVASVVEDGRVYQVGTYNGNPLGMAATKANLLEVLTPDAYEHLAHLDGRIVGGCNAIIDEFDLEAYTVSVGSKGCVTFSTEKIVDYESYMKYPFPELYELNWLYNMNRGIFITPGREDEWTLSVTHTDEAVDRYVEVFRELATELRA